MKKLVVLKLDGDFSQGFRVSLAIGEDASIPDIELSDNELKLPPIPILSHTYQDWSKSYRSLDGHRIKAKKEQITNVKFQSLKQECQTKADIIKNKFITWLQADSFRLIKEQCLTHLNTTDEIRIIIRSTETQLRKLPWHFWDLFEYYPHAEIAFSSLSSQRFSRKFRPNIRILIILGNSEGINVLEDEKLLKKYCQQAETVVLIEPSPSQLNEHLWNETGWDILFFSGHSRTESTQGRIFLNRSDSLTMEELRYGLQTAVKQGLQLALFNSCDGLGIAAELENLHIPQVIVMREPVPDRVANQFLKYFLEEFTRGKSLYQSVNTARKKLQGLEPEFPCASWLPVIVQNLLETPPTWQSLGAIYHCPYRGLAAFSEADAPYFYGREAVTQQLVTAVKQKNLVAVVGASGSGKSSVVFAGLIPQLRQDKTQHWLILSFRPGNNPLANLAMVLSGGVGSGEWGMGSGENFASFPNTQPSNTHPRLAELELEVELRQRHSLGDMAAKTLPKLLESIITTSPQSHLVIIADQFEELYTLCHHAEERQIFLDHLLDAVATVPNFTLVLTLRADFFGEALSYRRFADALQDTQLNLGPMNAPELATAITKPAEAFNVQLEPGLTPRLIDAVLESPSHLPLLEFTLTQLWQKQQQGWLTHQAYADIGGIETALANHAESIYAQLSLADQERVQQIFIQLVQPGEHNADIRRLATREEVGEANWYLVAQLADAPLVVTNYNQLSQIETVEIIHEALIKNWRRLRQWMRNHREFRHWQEQLRVVIRQWENSHQDTGGLLRGKPLLDAEEWLMQRPTEINAYEHNFINLSLARKQKEQQEKTAIKNKIIIGLTSGLIGTLILASLALFQWLQADYQRQQVQLNQLKSLSLSAKLLAKSGDEVTGLIPVLQSLKTLEALNPLDSKTKIDILGSILEVINQVREYNRLTGHEGEVTSFNFSPNGQILASASENTIRIWGRKGNLLQTLPSLPAASLSETQERYANTGHNHGLFSVIFSPDSQLLIAASFDHNITAWRYNSQTNLFAEKPIFQITEKEGLWAVSISPDHSTLAIATANGKVKFWTMDGQLLQTISAHSQKIWHLNFSSDGQTFATASADQTVKVWNLSGELLTTLQGHSDQVLSVNFSPDGQTLATASKDKTVKVWDLTGKLLHNFAGHSDEVLDVRFSPDGELIASASADDTVRVWSVEQQKQLYKFSGHGGKASEVSFSPDGQTLASASKDKTVKLWRLQGILPSFSGNYLSISPDGEIVAVSNQKGIVNLRQGDGTLLRSFAAHNGEIIKVVFHPQGKSIVTIGRDNQIKLWDLSGNLLNSWLGHESNNQNIIPFAPIQDISFSPDGNQIVTIGGIDKEVRIWNLEGSLLKSWQTNDIFLTRINFSPDGKTLATAGDKTVKLWNLSGKLLQTLSGHEANVSTVNFSADGKIIATAAADKTVKLWHIQTGEMFRSLLHNENVYSIGFSPHGQVLITANADEINFWNLDGELVHSLGGHEGIISQVNLSLDGKFMASVDINNQVILWSLDINDLQALICDWLQDYLRTNQGLDVDEQGICQRMF
ncbi:eIF2A-related protein [Nodularia spumigena]|uniref:nSTAND1 domain-containing NTPase n=1 Tax=Nodularia spumigena TaxID=70799 RepID=UPI00232C4E21|nr:CHAT domain-containing protein [Nodularia spumigena]MDB9348062.1 CHAT domain-containing protein [Nodularia spumigena CS-588/01]MDB9353333.1 CHAT domain-containing protein [Nodularia spumigena CS-588/05]